ncbi:MAG TPA: zinc ribbon domain-containing protein [Promineifilum sp.]|nr:zinc ribbon domain-containing protein [Promineifilum sp.]HQF71052.1 zinc ribbon domain-containing protein [Promineifilum sp.]
MTTSTCPHCTAVNRPGAIFCNACGRPLGSGPLPACAVRNAVLRPGSRFCSRCGHRQDAAVVVEVTAGLLAVFYLLLLV